MEHIFQLVKLFTGNVKKIWHIFRTYLNCKTSLYLFYICCLALWEPSQLELIVDCPTSNVWLGFGKNICWLRYLWKILLILTCCRMLIKLRQKSTLCTALLVLWGTFWYICYMLGYFRVQRDTCGTTDKYRLLQVTIGY